MLACRQFPAASSQPLVQGGEAGKPGQRREQPFPDIADLVFNLSLRATYAAFGHGSPEAQPDAGVQATGSKR